MYFIGYVLFEIPCNIILKRTTPRMWLPTLAIAWGTVSTLMGIVNNLSGFLASRFFLGVTESGLFPGVVFYFSMWYRRRERQYRISLFFSGAALAGAFGGILAYVRCSLCISSQTDLASLADLTARALAICEALFGRMAGAGSSFW